MKDFVHLNVGSELVLKTANNRLLEMVLILLHLHNDVIHISGTNHTARFIIQFSDWLDWGNSKVANKPAAAFSVKTLNCFHFHVTDLVFVLVLFFFSPFEWVWMIKKVLSQLIFIKTRGWFPKLHDNPHFWSFFHKLHK